MVMQKYTNNTVNVHCSKILAGDDFVITRYTREQNLSCEEK